MFGRMRIGILTACLILLAANMAMAATEEEKQLAVENGLAYLADNQDGDGSWPADDYGGIYSSTGSSVLAFLQAKGYWGDNASAYQAVVDKGLDFILSNARLVEVSIQPAGDPDGDGNTYGVKLYPSDSGTNYDIYATSMCLPAIAASGTPDKVVGAGPLAGWTYRDVVQNVIDYLAWAQNDPGGYNGSEGGWWNSANYIYRSDQADTQWAVIAGMYASLMGVSYPEFVLDELAIWTDYIQDVTTGAAGITSPTSLYQNPEGQTGALLTMLFFLGRNPGISSVDRALNYINNIWNSDASSILFGNFGRPYTMRAIYNGLGFMIGLDDEETITNLRPDPGDTDNPNHNYNWWEDYCEFLVSSQNPDGHWEGDINWNQWVATPWYIYILVPGFDSGDSGNETSEIEVPVDIKPAACPNQLNVMSKGMLAVAIAGSEALDVTTIDPLTIRLAGAVPSHYSYDDVTSPYNPMTGKEDAYACTEAGPDGYPDMILKFDTQAIMAAIGEVEDGDVRVLNLTGDLQAESGGTAIIGEDVISILKKAKGRKEK